MVPALLLWEVRDGATHLWRTERGEPDSSRELQVPAGWDYAAAPDSAEVVAIRGREAKFGWVGADGIVLDSEQSFLWLEEGLTAACIGTGTPAAFLGIDDNSFLVLGRDGGWARVDAVGTLGDCAWLDREHLLVVYEGASDPMRIHPMTSGEPMDAGIGGRDPAVSGGWLVVRDRSVEPAEMVMRSAPPTEGLLRPPIVRRFRPVEPGTRYLSGVASPDGDWLAIVGDRERPDGSSESVVSIVDLRVAEDTTWSVSVDFPLTAVSWPG